MPTGIRKTRKTAVTNAPRAAKVAPSPAVAFHSGFYIRKEGNTWVAKTNDQTIVALDADRDTLVARVQATAQALTALGGNTEVTVCNDIGLFETRYNYWNSYTLENYQKGYAEAASGDSLIKRG
jgi:hypothetical protein